METGFINTSHEVVWEVKLLKLVILKKKKKEGNTGYAKTLTLSITK